MSNSLGPVSNSRAPNPRTIEFDCVVVGAGPAGLMAGVYLARFRRSVLILDGGESRAELIPKSHNAPTYQYGISGPALLAQLRKQAAAFGALIMPARVKALSGKRGEFLVEAGSETLVARTVLLATGVSDNLPPHLKGLPRLIKTSRLRLCPICDAYELIDQPIFVLGDGEHGAREALYLRSYSSKIVLFLHDAEKQCLPTSWCDRLKAASVELVTEKIESLSTVPDGVQVRLAGATPRRARAMYVALGATVHSELATALGARCDEQGYLEVDRQQRTTVNGLYAAGDVVQSLSQISVGFGQAAIAASAIHQTLDQIGAQRFRQDPAPSQQPERAM